MAFVTNCNECGRTACVKNINNEFVCFECIEARITKLTGKSTEVRTAEQKVLNEAREFNDWIHEQDNLHLDVVVARAMRITGQDNVLKALQHSADEVRA